MTSRDFTFYSRAEYFADIARRAAKARQGDCIAIATMNFSPSDPMVQRIFEALGAAAERGADVILLVDAYNFLVGEHKELGPLIFRRTLPRRMPAGFQKRLETLEKLASRGVRYTITNLPTRTLSNPASGRSHIKFAIVNDRVYIGGCNLSDASQIDIMTAWESQKTAEWLHDFAKKMLSNEGTRFMGGKDLEFPVDAKSRILVDAGARKQSDIYKNALALVDQAEKEIFITCQYFPGSTTAKHLLAAHRRGVRVTIVFSPPSIHGRETPAHHLHNLRERMRLPKEFFVGQLPKSSPKLHAKVLASEKTAIIGSHNFVVHGVNWGTAEIALVRHDPDFARQAIETLLRQLQST